MKLLAILFSLTLFLGVNARAATLTETFDSRADFASGTAVWNQVLGKVHPTLLVRDYDGTFSDFVDISVGDGSDGPFNNTTYVNFSVGGDLSLNTIRIDTNVHPVLKLTQFTLDFGWKIIPLGTNPLIIESLSTVKILGEIHCEGEDGVMGAGGAGHCGGGNGGDGGLANQGGTDGANTDTLVTGGRGGNFNPGFGVGGGGGGSWNNTTNPSLPSNGPNSSVAGGQAGTATADPAFLTIAGGAGGGGGSGDLTSAGGGGGGGGGAIIIHAVGDIEIGASPSSIFGYIFASGGKGGDASVNGGPGGGGGGGSIQLFTGGLLNFYNSDAIGASQALAGPGGTNPGGAIGATGGMGRSWISTSIYTQSSGVYNPIEAPGGVNSGLIEYTKVPETITTRIFDTANNFANVNSLNLTPVSSDFLFEVAGSSDGFVSDNTGWTTNTAVVSNKRYLKMRLSITSSNPTTPDMIDTAAITYSPGSPDNFTFQSAGCGRVDGSPLSNLLFLMIAPLLLMILKFKTKRKAAG